MKAKRADVTLAQFRHRQLVAVTKPLFHLNLGIHVACMLRSMLTGFMSSRGMAETFMEVAYIASYLTFHALPISVLQSGRTAWLQPTCIMSHLTRSLLMFSLALGMAQDTEAVTRCLEMHGEIAVELALAFQDQISLPIMATLHALRQAAWMSVLVWRMHGDPFYALLRGVLNWAALTALTCTFEWRTRFAYHKLRHTQQQQEEKQQQQEKQPSLPRPVPPLPLIEGASEFTSHLPEPVKPSTDAARCCSSQQASAGASTARAGQHKHQTLTPTQAAINATAQLSGRSAAEHPATTTSQLLPQQVALPGRSIGLSQALMPPSDLPPGQQDAASSIMQVIQQQRRMTSTYTRNTAHSRYTVNVKIKGVELDDLPPDMSSIMEKQLQHSMPGMVMSGLAFRNGCVMMTVDLMDLMAQPTLALASSMMDLVTRVMRNNTMGQLLNTGATMCIQAPDEVVVCQWDADSSSYALASTPAGQLGPDHSCCQLISATPAVHTMSDSSQATVAGSERAAPGVGVEEASNDDGRMLTFTVELQLPRDCRLDGWQPSHVSSPVSPGGSAMLLARRMGGGYLPVTVERVSCVVGPGGAEAGMRHIAEVVVEIACGTPALLRLELWYNQQPTQMAAAGSELLVSHVPLLVLGCSCQAAASQLHRHMDGMGGVQPCQAYPAADPACDAARCLLEELGMWLTHHHSSALYEGLANDLLTHVVLHGLGDVAELMVATLQRGAGAASAHSAWLQQATHVAPGDGDGMSAGNGCGDGVPMPLLHAAMASGQPTMLQRVLRWGALYGGPSWAWPWELEYGEQGCTALHLAAAQPACPALLETITRTLPPDQVQAARSMWLFGQDGVGVPPAQVFALACQGGSSGEAWANMGMAAAGEGRAAASSGMASYAADSSGADTATAGTWRYRPKAAASGGPNTAAASGTLQATVSAPPPAPPRGDSQSLLSSVIEVWTTRETDEYRAWAKQQMSSLVLFWAATLVFMAIAGCIRSYMAGCGLHEVPQIMLHTVPYILMVAAPRGITWLGDWQAWMPAMHVFHCLGYLAKTYVPSGKAFLKVAAAASPAALVYVVMVAVLDQTPLPLLLVAHTVEAYCHSLTYTSAGIPNPLRQALLVHACALAVSTLCRVWQLRAFRRWQAVQQRSKQLDAKSA